MKRRPKVGRWLLWGLVWVVVILGSMQFFGSLYAPPDTEVYAGRGTYSARTTGSLPHELLASSIRANVAREGSHLLIQGTETIGQTVVDLPLIAGEITWAGAIALSRQGSLSTFSAPQCGSATASDLSMAFVDEKLRITERMITPMCGEVWFSALLVKE